MDAGSQLGQTHACMRVEQQVKPALTKAPERTKNELIHCNCAGACQDCARRQVSVQPRVILGSYLILLAQRLVLAALERPPLFP